MIKYIGVGPAAVAAVVLMGGCASPIGHSTLPIDKKISHLSIDEAMSLCEYIIGIQEQPTRDVDCGDNRVVTVGIDPEDVADSISACISQIQNIDESCAADVGDFEMCFEASAHASDELICSPDLPPSCVPVARCI